MRGIDVRHPVAHGFADCILQSPRLPLATPTTQRAQKAHAKDVQLLAAHVLFAHIDDALESKKRADCGGRNAVLTRSGFGDDPLLTHPASEQPLPQAVIDFVRARVEQILPLQINSRATQRFAQPPGMIERRGTPRVILQQIGQFGLKRRIAAGRVISALQFLERRHQRFGNEASAVRTKVSRRIGLGCGHHAAFLAASTNRRTLS